MVLQLVQMSAAANNITIRCQNLTIVLLQTIHTKSQQETNDQAAKNQQTFLTFGHAVDTDTVTLICLKSRYPFHLTEILKRRLARCANGTDPSLGQIFKSCARGNVNFRIALFRIVDVAAGAALVPIEGFSFSGSIAHSSKRVGKLILKYTLKIIAEDGRLISTNS